MLLLPQSAIELIQVFPPGANAKNGADIKLCLDVMEDMVRFPHVGTIIVVGGDSDYMPLSYKVKAAGRKLVGIGGRRATNQHWARSCHEFKYYEVLQQLTLAAQQPVESANDVANAGTGSAGSVQDEGASPASWFASSAETPTEAPARSEDPVLMADHDNPIAVIAEVIDDDATRTREVRDLLAKALSRLAQSKGDPWVNKAGLRPFVQRMDSTFHESNYGFATFSELVASMPDLIEVRKGEFDHELRLRA